MIPSDLPSPPRIFPFISGRYTVLPGLSQLAQEPAINIDSLYPSMIAQKQMQLSGDFGRYVQYSDFDPGISHRATQLLADRAVKDHPRLFRREADHFTAPMTTIDLSRSDSFDQVCRQLQEDVVVIRKTGDRDFNCAIHLCFPNGWSAADKIGQTFFQTHTPVAGIEGINARAPHWVSMMIGARQGLVRFAWGIRFDDFLDHHPDSPALAWNRENPRAWVRVERQTILGLPEVSAAVFLIRTYLYPCHELNLQERSQLALAIEGMSEPSAAYKGIASCRGELIAWLSNYLNTDLPQMGHR